MLADVELVDRLRAGDEGAFVTLVERYHGPLLRLAATFVPSRAVAEEVVQETWLGVVRGIDRFEGRSSLKTWVFRILVNRARTAGVRARRETPADLGAEPAVPASRFAASGHWADPPAAWADDADARLDAASAAERVRRFVEDLPDGQRQVVVLRDVEGLPAEEVCALLGITAGNQRVLLHRGRSRVRRMIESEIGHTQSGEG